MELTCTHHEQREARARCVECGTLLCDECRGKVGGRNYCRPCVPEKLRRKLPGRRSPGFAAFLSAIPGLGQMYAGRFLRGLLFMGGAGAVGANIDAIADPLPIFLWVFNLFDAFAVAHDRNARVTGVPLDPSVSLQKKFWGLLGVLVAGFVVARNTGYPELNPDLMWPACLVLYGLFVVFDRRKVADVRHA